MPALGKSMERFEENLCESCERLGICCTHSYMIGNEKVYLPNFPCKFLNSVTGLCTVYEERFDRNPVCRSIVEMAKDDGPPPQCRYWSCVDFALKTTRIADPDEEPTLRAKLILGWIREEKVPVTLPEAIEKLVKRLVACHQKLHQGAAAGDAAVVREALAQGAYINIPARDGLTALHRAVGVGSVALVAYLIAEGGCLGAKTRLGETALDLALQGNDPEMVSLFVEVGG